MILPDVNVLVFAFRRESARHDEYAAWLTEVAGGPEELALADVVLTGFVRIVTNRRIYHDPAPTAAALDFVAALLGSRRTTLLPASDEVWTGLRALADADPQVRGNLVPDAWLAALALTHGARVATADRGFARFPGVRWFEPVGAA